MTGYRQNRPERVCETLLALAANAAVSREEALRQLYRKFGQPPAVLLAELSPSQRERVREGFVRRGWREAAE